MVFGFLFAGTCEVDDFFGLGGFFFLAGGGTNMDFVMQMASAQSWHGVGTLRYPFSFNGNSSSRKPKIPSTSKKGALSLTW